MNAKAKPRRLINETVMGRIIYETIQRHKMLRYGIIRPDKSICGLTPREALK